MSTEKTNEIKTGSKVNYHSIIGGPITSSGHVVKQINKMPNNFGGDVAWITEICGCVALSALSIDNSADGGKQ